MSTATVTIQDLFEAGVHFGHQTRYWNPKMQPYIYGARNKVHIIHLDKTLLLLEDALQFIRRVAARQGKILWVGTKSAARALIQEQAERCGMPYIDHRWLGGMLTNYRTVKQSIKRLTELETMRDDGTLDKLVKKEALLRLRELQKLQQSLGGIKEMHSLPDALFVVDVGHERIAVREANNLRIPVVGIVDTNNSPEGVDYLIPGNDDARRAISLYLTTVADLILEAKHSRMTHDDHVTVEIEGEHLSS